MGAERGLVRVPACPVERARGAMRYSGREVRFSREIPPHSRVYLSEPSASPNVSWFVPCQLSANGSVGRRGAGGDLTGWYSGAHTALVSLSKRSDGEHHPSGLWADCGFACEHLLDNEEPGGETAISEPFVIFPTGQKLI